MLIDFFRPLRRALFPVFIISQTLPLVAIAPLVVLWFGFGLAPKIMLVALVTFFPMLVALVQGYEATDAEIESDARLDGGSRAGASSGWRGCLRRCPISSPACASPSPMPSSARSSPNMPGAAKGLGIYILNAKNNFRPDLVLAAVLISASLTLILFGLTRARPAPRHALGAARRRQRESHDALELRGLAQARSAASTCWPTFRFMCVQGEFVSILGPSGAGKSTIFQLLTGGDRSGRRRDPVRRRAA